MILGQASVNPYVYSGPSKGMNLALKLYNDWERERKPFLYVLELIEFERINRNKYRIVQTWKI